MLIVQTLFLRYLQSILFDCWATRLHAVTRVISDIGQPTTQQPNRHLTINLMVVLLYNNINRVDLRYIAAVGFSYASNFLV